MFAVLIIFLSSNTYLLGKKIMLAQQGLQWTNVSWVFMTVIQRQIHPVWIRDSTTNVNVIQDFEKQMTHNVKVLVQEFFVQNNISIHCKQARKHASDGSTLSLKPYKKRPMSSKGFKKLKKKTETKKIMCFKQTKIHV